MIQLLLIKEELCCCFVDLFQAFDTPNHNLLWSTLLKSGVSPKFTRIFANIYSHATARVRTSAGATDPIPIAKGVLQGESASPALFNLFIEGLTQQLYSKTLGGIKLGKRLVHFLLYADDLVIVAQNKETLVASFSNHVSAS